MATELSRATLLCVSAILLCCSTAGSDEAPEGTRPGQDSSKLRFSRERMDVRLEIGNQSNRRMRLENLGAEPAKLSQLEVQGEGVRVSLHPNLSTPAEPLPEGGKLDILIEPAQFVRLEIEIHSEGLEERSYESALVAHFDGLEPVTLPIVIDVQPEEGEDYDPETSKWRPDNLVTEGPEPRVVFEHYVHDFGECLTGQLMKTSFKFRNEGEGDLIINAIRKQCHCSFSGLVLPEGPVSRARMKREPIGVLRPGEEGELLVQLDTSGQPGDIRKQVYFYTNDPSRNHQTTLIIGATVHNPFKTKPGSVKFGDVRCSEGAELKVLLSAEEIGDYSVVGHSMAAPSPLDVEYRLVRRPKKPGVHWELLFRVREHAPFGPHLDTIKLEIDHAFVKELTLTFEVNVLSDVFFTGTETDRLDLGAVLADRNREGRFEIVNHNPDIPYIPTSVEVQPTLGDNSAFETEIVELEPGVRYEVVFRVKGKPSIRYMRGHLIVHSDHPQVREKRLEYNGIYRGN